MKSVTDCLLWLEGKKIYKVDDLYNNFLLYFEISELVTSSSLCFYFPAN